MQASRFDLTACVQYITRVVQWAESIYSIEVMETLAGFCGIACILLAVLYSKWLDNIFVHKLLTGFVLFLID